MKCHLYRLGRGCDCSWNRTCESHACCKDRSPGPSSAKRWFTRLQQRDSQRISWVRNRMLHAECRPKRLRDEQIPRQATYHHFGRTRKDIEQNFKFQPERVLQTSRSLWKGPRTDATCVHIAGSVSIGHVEKNHWRNLVFPCNRAWEGVLANTFWSFFIIWIRHLVFGFWIFLWDVIMRSFSFSSFPRGSNFPGQICLVLHHVVSAKVLWRPTAERCGKGPHWWDVAQAVTAAPARRLF